MTVPTNPPPLVPSADYERKFVRWMANLFLFGHLDPRVAQWSHPAEDVEVLRDCGLRRGLLDFRVLGEPDPAGLVQIHGLQFTEPGRYVATLQAVRMYPRELRWLATMPASHEEGLPNVPPGPFPGDTLTETIRTCRGHSGWGTRRTRRGDEVVRQTAPLLTIAEWPPR